MVELLVVIAIVAILATASSMAFRGVNSALNLSTAGQAVVAEITTARQTALTYSETVEVRFYIYPDVNTGGSQQIQAIQTFASHDGTTYTQIDRINYLPSNIIIDQGKTGSGAYPNQLSYPIGETSSTVNPVCTPNSDQTISVNGVKTSGTGVASIPAVGYNYSYKVLRFKIDGSVDYVIPTSGAPTSWPPATWYATLYEIKYAASTVAASSIQNFLTVSVDSIDGRVRTFQP